ncbi:MAG: hypothetical protein HC921_12210, partial [Synechococcaceae cyanobacterium SM2_3_1]|nr:hypothetical protein [Synechococcaceae cyanobacterium SM2_3_1]
LVGAAVGTEPQEIASNLQVVQLQTTALLEQNWEELKKLEAQYLRSPFFKAVYGQELGLLPGMDDALALDALMLTVQALAPLQPTYRVLLTLIPPWPSRDGSEARTFLQDAKLPMFKQGIRRMVAYQKAALEGVPVYQANDPRAKVAWNDYVAVGKEILP